MKTPAQRFKMLALFCCMPVVFSNCFKESPVIDPPDPVIPWRLTFINAYYWEYPPMDFFANQWHEFTYNTYNKVWVDRQKAWSYNDPELQRLDTFLYGNGQRLSEIRSILYNAVAPIVQKKVILYNPAGRKSGTLRYIRDAAGQYRLVDSTVYKYNGSTIFMMVHHVAVQSPKPYPPAGSIDTSYFVYDHRGNMTSVYLRHEGKLLYNESNIQYDTAPNPYLQLGVEGLELEPWYSSMSNYKGVRDAILLAQMPRLSKNNIKSFGADNYEVDRSPRFADSLLPWQIVSRHPNPDPELGFEFGQAFEYKPAP
jgi:hypothetical protein